MPTTMIATGLAVQLAANVYAIFDLFGGFGDWWNTAITGSTSQIIYFALFLASLVVQAVYLFGVRGQRWLGFIMAVYTTYIVGFGSYGIYQEFKETDEWSKQDSLLIIYFTGLLLGGLGTYVSAYETAPAPKAQHDGRYQLILV